MTAREFADYYEILEVSPNANSFTIERVFRFLAKRYHPDVAESGDVQRFSLIVEAYEVLRDANARVEYDVELASRKRQASELVGDSRNAEADSDDRHRILSLFYSKRKRDMKNPGVGIGTLESAFNIPAEITDFHLWYLSQKGWIQREESGLYSITAAGIDKIEERVLHEEETNDQKITDGVLRLTDQSLAQLNPDFTVNSETC